MRKGEVWWADFGERRLVVVLSDEADGRFEAMQVVAPAGIDIDGLGVEVTVGTEDGLPSDGVLRWAFPQPGFTFCTWELTLSPEDVTDQVAVLSDAKLQQIDAARDAGRRGSEGAPDAAVRMGEIRDALRLAARRRADGVDD
ncbi:type II toxin-antitoxin system PemK/MazF family toxin [Microbispora sp. RL4-1S]|uniref:Type II toxin-antitoxin system PemK/MazF family toxin n=1 Tax=Microbispora oryzae TaxID=2806554 RepID=A0A940WIP4_9ACTN|nr:type II toxin-antitoxin system PemK/MazF family toxin [Microbispora oryzae]MBP2704672.1 type II toxin-antitoxin system PemK/MazF family toxin [Microbispora oryzae]